MIATLKLGCIVLLVNAALLTALPAAGQQSAEAPPLPDDQRRMQVVLEKAATASEELYAHLPSFTCTEAGFTDEAKGGKHKNRVDFSGDLTVRASARGQLSERLTLTSRKNKPFSGDEFDLPYFVRGGFQQALDFFTPDRRVCYNFTLTGQRIDFETATGVDSRLGCTGEQGFRGFALLDADDQITHIERTLPDEVARLQHLAPFAAVDLAPVELNGQVYRLSSHLSSDRLDGKTTLHFEADYTACRLFKATITIRPGTRPVTEDSSQP